MGLAGPQLFGIHQSPHIWGRRGARHGDVLGPVVVAFHRHYRASRQEIAYLRL